MVKDVVNKSRARLRSSAMLGAIGNPLAMVVGGAVGRTVQSTETNLPEGSMVNTSDGKAVLLRDGLTEKYLASIWAAVLVGLTLGFSPPAAAQQQQSPQQKQCDVSR